MGPLHHVVILGARFSPVAAPFRVPTEPFPSGAEVPRVRKTRCRCVISGRTAVMCLVTRVWPRTWKW